MPLPPTADIPGTMEEINILVGPKQKLQNVSFGKIIFDSLHRYGHKIAMIDAVSGKETTYNEILQKSVSLAQYLSTFGLGKSDTISICNENNENFTIVIISAFYLGITIAPINHFYTPREIIHALNISKPKVIFCSSILFNNVTTACKNVNTVKKIIVLDNKVEVPSAIDKLEHFIKLPMPKEFFVSDVELNHTAAVLCSSGTTGMPKGVMLSHKNFQSALLFLQNPYYANYNSMQIGTGLMPFYHAYGFITHLCMLIAHVKIIVFPRFEETLFLRSIEKYKITSIVLVPPLLLLLGKSSLVKKYDLSSVKEIMCGAASLSKEAHEFAMNSLGINNIRQGYGLTEATLAISLQPAFARKPGSSGVIGPGIKCKIRDINTDQALGPYQTGEVCTKGAYVMKGYLGDKNATDAMIDSEGWLRTGDIGYYDEDKCLYVIDRIKELIKYKGYQVPPAEIEDLLLSHPEIKDCAVIGKPDEAVGELPVAFVVKQPNGTLTEKDVIDFVAKNASVQKHLRGGVKFVNEIPKSPTGKILRRILREQLKIKSKI